MMQPYEKHTLYFPEDHFNDKRVIYAEVVKEENGQYKVEYFVQAKNPDKQECSYGTRGMEITLEILDEMFPAIRTDKLKDASFMRYTPQTERQKIIYNIIKYRQIPSFRCPIMKPSVDKYGQLIFERGQIPLSHQDVERMVYDKNKPYFYGWARKAYANFLPEKKSRVGVPTEYIFFMAELIRYLVEEEGSTAENAWEIVCEGFVDYFEKKGITPGSEITGVKHIGKWCDLADTVVFESETPPPLTGDICHKLEREKLGFGSFIHDCGYYDRFACICPWQKEKYCRYDMGAYPWMTMDV